MLSTLKNWFNRLNTPDVEPLDDHDDKLNPLGWGTLFFTVWISIKVLQELNTKKITPFQAGFQNGFGWLLLVVSVALLVSIYFPRWRDILKKFTKKFYPLPAVVILSIIGFILGWVPGFALKGSDQWLVGVIGFLWLITPILVLIARFDRPLHRSFVSVMMLIAWIYLFSSSRFNFIGSWPLFAIAVLSWWPCIWPKRFRDISVI